MLLGYARIIGLGWTRTRRGRANPTYESYDLTTGAPCDGAATLSRAIRPRARVPGPAGAQHQSVPRAGAQPPRRARVQRSRHLHPTQERARSAPARAGDPAGRLSRALALRVF